MHSARNVAVSLRPLFAFSWRLVLILTVFRAIFVAWQWPRVVAADMLVATLLQGLRFDLVLLGLLLVFPLLLFPVLASNRTLLPAWRALLRIGLPLALLFVVFMECSTPSFINQFDGRPNILFLEYLNHPREIAATLWAAYKLSIVTAVFLVSAITWVVAQQLGKLVVPIRPTGFLPALAVTPLLLIVCFGLIRSTTDHRPVNPSTVALSNDPLVNELALSSAYTVLYAAYETRHEQKGGFRYAQISDSDVIAEVQSAMMLAPESFTSNELPTMHYQGSAGSGGPARNLVIIIEESLGAEFVGSLGGLDLTPGLDALSKEGIWLSNLYATGTRSVRGLEAVVSGFTPTPARSVVKLGRSQRNFFTLAGFLAARGYDTSFIYGGESQFDNMRRFFMNNGFARVIDKKDYQNPVFSGSWGVSDEDLFDRAHQEFSAERNRPFFSVVFSSSNHSPFEFPEGRVDVRGDGDHTVNDAVRYADYALDRFIRQARASDYWEDTIFLIVADHNSRVYGADVVPVERFHIPGLIVGGPISPIEIDTVASQIDLGPTLLSLLGVSGEHPMVGRDLTRPDVQRSPGRAIMQFNGTQAYMEGDQVVVLRKDLPVEQFIFTEGHLVAEDFVDEALAKRAIAHSAWSSMAYEKSLYRLPASAANASRTLQ